MNQRVCKVFELTEFEKEKVNEIMNLSFVTDLSQDRLSFSSELLVSLVSVDGVIVGTALAAEMHENTMEPLSNHFLNIHSLGVHPDHRGKGYCSYIVDAFVQKYGKERSMYLNVNTSKDNYNSKAIHCYQKNGFRLVDCLYEHQNGDPHSYMVRIKGKPKKPKKYRKKTKRRKKK